MQTLDSLGAGFSIATHDMDIRGFGNLLGEEQSGQIREVGVELYQSMLQSTIEEIKSHQENGIDISWAPQINIGISTLIPSNYIEDIHLRMGIYRRISNLSNFEDIEEFKVELIDRFGKYPEEVEHLFVIVKLKILCKQANISKIDASEKAVVIAFKDNIFANPVALLQYINENPGYIKIRPDQKIAFLRAYSDLDKRTDYIFTIINKLTSFL
jgi:transcription-repair coupling factor (superfamily II helicase)